MKANRLNKGDWYFFIQPSTLLPVATRDWYFDSDDQRYFDENYFITREAVNACAQALVPIASQIRELRAKAKDPLLTDEQRRAIADDIDAQRDAAESIIADSNKE